MKDYINVKLKEEVMGSNKLYIVEKEEGRQEIMTTGSIDNKWRKENIPERWKK